jgi:predicted dehydrogenase
VGSKKLGRREFVKSAVGAGVTLGAVGRATPAHARVLGANDRINVAVIGVGGRGTYLLRWVMETGGQITPPPPPFGPPRERKEPDPALATQVVSVCDVYAKRKNAAAEFAKCDSTLDYRQVLDRPDVDAVIIATPDHWHARMALEAMAKGKDVYLEKPVTHTVEEAKNVAAAVKKTGRVLQVGSQTTSSDQWWKARQAIQDGMIGR